MRENLRRANKRFRPQWAICPLPTIEEFQYDEFSVPRNLTSGRHSPHGTARPKTARFMSQTDRHWAGTRFQSMLDTKGLIVRK